MKIKIGIWNVVLSDDDDKHLTISATCDDSTSVFDVGEELGSSKEFMVRLSSVGIEKEYFCDSQSR